MQIGIIGLGKMGANMARRLAKSGHQVVGMNRSPDITRQLAAEVGLEPTFNPEELVGALQVPRAVWVMLPAGQATHDMIVKLNGLLGPGDLVIDGGNSNYKEDKVHAELLAPKGIDFVDVGTSGGIWGLSEGYSLMIGGQPGPVERLEPIFKSLAPAADRGWGHVGPHGAGHYVKMVHNGIEYGMMQAFAEGFDILHSKKELELDVAQIARIWQHGSVVRSWLLDLTADALAADKDMTEIQGYVPDSGEGRWTVADAIDLDVPAPIITLALMMRFVSRDETKYAARLLAAMRKGFGGHAVKVTS
jgi:6-phosphogluconate dehydrogenase